MIVLKRTLRIGAPRRTETISTKRFVFGGWRAVRASITSLAQIRLPWIIRAVHRYHPRSSSRKPTLYYPISLKRGDRASHSTSPVEPTAKISSIISQSNKLCIFLPFISRTDYRLTGTLRLVQVVGLYNSPLFLILA